MKIYKLLASARAWQELSLYADKRIRTRRQCNIDIQDGLQLQAYRTSRIEYINAIRLNESLDIRFGTEHFPIRFTGRRQNRRHDRRHIRSTPDAQEIENRMLDLQTTEGQGALANPLNVSPIDEQARDRYQLVLGLKLVQYSATRRS